MVTGTKFRGDRSRGFLYLPTRKFEPVTYLPNGLHLPNRAFLTQAARGATADSQLDDAAADADRNSLRAVARAELIHDVFDVDLDSLFGDKKLLRDVPIPVSAGNVAEHVDLAQGEVLVAH